MKSAPCTAMHNTTVDIPSGRSLLVDLLVYVLGEGLFVREVEGQDQPEDAESWILQHACEAKKVVLFPSLSAQKEDSGQSQGVGWLSNCRSDQLAEHAQSLFPRKTDLGDLCYESQRRESLG